MTSAVGRAREKRRAAHAVGRPGSHAQDRKIHRPLHPRDGPVVLGEIDRRHKPDLLQAFEKRRHRPARQADEAGVEDGDVLARE